MSKTWNNRNIYEYIQHLSTHSTIQILAMQWFSHSNILIIVKLLHKLQFINRVTVAIVYIYTDYSISLTRKRLGHFSVPCSHTYPSIKQVRKERPCSTIRNLLLSWASWTANSVESRPGNVNKIVKRITLNYKYFIWEQRILPNSIIFEILYILFNKICNPCYTYITHKFFFKFANYIIKTLCK